MTDIILTIKNESLDLNVKGHANYNPGADVVCSAISQLVCTFASLVEERTDIVINELYLDYADVRINISNINPIEAHIQFIIRGFELLEEAYEENVHFVLEN